MLFNDSTTLINAISSDAATAITIIRGIIIVSIIIKLLEFFALMCLFGIRSKLDYSNAELTDLSDCTELIANQNTQTIQLLTEQNILLKQQLNIMQSLYNAQIAHNKMTYKFEQED